MSARKQSAKAELLAGLVAKAQKQQRRFMSAGAFDKFRLCYIKVGITTKLGVAFEQGEVTIAAPRAYWADAGWKGHKALVREVYSFRNQVMTEVLDVDTVLL